MFAVLFVRQTSSHVQNRPRNPRHDFSLILGAFRNLGSIPRTKQNNILSGHWPHYPKALTLRWIGDFLAFGTVTLTTPLTTPLQIK